jgi:putative toxin-antitoxin system antitoxin component (TIGR02293 family)
MAIPEGGKMASKRRSVSEIGSNKTSAIRTKSDGSFSGNAKSLSGAVLSRHASGSSLAYRDLVKGVAAVHVREIMGVGLVRREDVRRIIPDRTLERRLSQGGNLTVEEADGIARLERVVRHARETFGNAEIADEWLRSPNPALGKLVPIHMSATDVGAREVETVLGRIAYGVYS